MRRFFTGCMLLLIVSTLNAQKRGQARIDSMMQMLPVSQDTVGAHFYYDLSLALIPIDPERARAFADTGMTLSKKLKWEKGIAYFHIVRGNLYNVAGKKDESIKEYTQALKISERIAHPHGICYALNDMGGAYLRASDFTKAIGYYTRALAIAEKIGDHNMLGTTLSNIATVYYSQANYGKAIEYHNKSLKEFKLLGDPDKIARTLNYIGNVYFNEGDIAGAEKNYLEALVMYERSNNKTGMAILYSQIGILYEPDYQKIIDYQMKSQAIWDSINPTHYNSIINLGNIGETYLNFIRVDTLNQLSTTQRKKYLDQAATYLERALAYSRQTNDLDNLSYFAQILAEQQEMKGDYKSALGNYKLGVGIRDSLFSQEQKNRIAGIESQREIDQRDQQLEINRLEMAAQRRLRIGMIAGIALLIVVAILLIRQSRTRKRTNTTLIKLNNELDEANKVKARFFAILSHDLRSPVANLISFLELQQQQPDVLSPTVAAQHQQRIADSANSLLETMEAMLLWSKGQMENFQPQLRIIPVKELFDHIRQFFSSQTSVELRFKDPGTASIHTDENYLQTIMHNLTANAIKALSHQHGGYVEWEAKTEKGKTILSITDNGPGTTPEQVKALYEDSAVPNSRTGFGLHLIRDLASAIKCRIAMQSEKGKGTTFTLWA